MSRTAGAAAIACTMAGSPRSTRRLTGRTDSMRCVRASSVMSMSLSTRPYALALVTGTSRPVRFGSPFAPPPTLVAEQL